VWQLVWRLQVTTTISIRFKLLTTVAFIICGLPALGAEHALLVKQAYQSNSPWPMYSESTDSAYTQQKLFIHSMDEEIIGYKAGITSPGSQERFNLSEPVSGVLLGSMRSGSEVDTAEFRRMMLEVELGFYLTRKVTEPVQRISQISELILRIVPVVELPDLGFEDPANLGGPSIIASNVSARRFIVGEFTRQPDDLNQIEVQLSHDGSVIMQDVAGGVLGDQRRALIWLVNTVLSHGYRVLPGHLLITGAIGQMVPGQMGHYDVSFSELGQLSFVIVDSGEMR